MKLKGSDMKRELKFQSKCVYCDSKYWLTANEVKVLKDYFIDINLKAHCCGHNSLNLTGKTKTIYFNSFEKIAICVIISLIIKWWLY